MFKCLRQTNILYIHSSIGSSRTINKPLNFLKVQVCYIKSRNVNDTPGTAKCLKNICKILWCSEERAKEICNEYPKIECGLDELAEKIKFLKSNKISENAVVENPFLLVEDNSKSLD